MPLKKNALGPSEAACIEEYKVVSKEDGGWLVTLFVSTPKVSYSFCNTTHSDADIGRYQFSMR